MAEDYDIMKDWLERVEAYLVNRSGLFTRGADANRGRTGNQPPAQPPAQPPVPPANPQPKITAKIDKEKVKAIAAKAVGAMAKKAMAAAAAADKLAKEQRKRAEDAKKVAKKAIQAFASAAKLAAAEADEKKTAKLKKEKEVAEEIAKEAMKAAKLAEELADAADEARQKAKEDAAAEVKNAAAAMAKAAAEAAKKATADAAAAKATAAKQAEVAAAELAAAQQATEQDERAAAEQAAKQAAAEEEAAKQAATRAITATKAAAKQADLDQAAAAERAAAEATTRNAAAAEANRMRAAADKENMSEAAKSAINAAITPDEFNTGSVDPNERLKPLGGGSSNLRKRLLLKTSVVKKWLKTLQNDRLFKKVLVGGDVQWNNYKTGANAYNFSVEDKNILQDLCSMEPKSRFKIFNEFTSSYLNQLTENIPKERPSIIINFWKGIKKIYNEAGIQNPTYMHPLAQYFTTLYDKATDTEIYKIRPYIVQFLEKNVDKELQVDLNIFGKHVTMYHFINNYNDQLTQMCNMSIPNENAMLEKLRTVLIDLNKLGLIKEIPQLTDLQSAKGKIASVLKDGKRNGKTKEENARDLISQTALGLQDTWKTEYQEEISDPAAARLMQKPTPMPTPATEPSTPALITPAVSPLAPLRRGVPPARPATAPYRKTFNIEDPLRPAFVKRLKLMLGDQKRLLSDTDYKSFVSSLLPPDKNVDTFIDTLDTIALNALIQRMSAKIKEINNPPIKSSYRPTTSAPNYDNVKSRYLDQKTKPSASRPRTAAARPGTATAARPGTATPRVPSAIPLQASQASPTSLASSSELATKIEKTPQLANTNEKKPNATGRTLNAEGANRARDFVKSMEAPNGYVAPMPNLNMRFGGGAASQNYNHYEMFIQKALALYITTNVLLNTYMMQELSNLDPTLHDKFISSFDDACHKSPLSCENQVTDFGKFMKSVMTIVLFNAKPSVDATDDKNNMCDIKSVINANAKIVAVPETLQFEKIDNVGYCVDRKQFNTYLQALCKAVQSQKGNVPLLSQLISLLDISIHHYLENLDDLRTSVEQLNDDQTVELFKNALREHVTDNVITYIRFRHNNDDDYNKRFETFVKYSGNKTFNRANATSFVMNYNADALPYYTDSSKGMISIPEEAYVKHQQSMNQFAGGSDQKFIHTVPEFVKYQFYGGPFTRIFFPKETNENIAHDCTEVLTSLKAGKSVFVIGYGASGAGKTSTLVYFNGNAQKQKEDGILIHLLKELKCDVTINSYEFLNTDDGERERQQIKDYEFLFNKDGELLTLKNIQNYQNEHKNNTIEQITEGASLSEVLLRVVHDDRLVISTPNNPQSSRSHVLIQVQIHQPNTTKPTYLFLGDFAGVENRFDCSDSDTIKRFAEVKQDGVSQRFYNSTRLEKEVRDFKTDLITRTNNSYGTTPNYDTSTLGTEECNIKEVNIDTIPQDFTIDWFSKPTCRFFNTTPYIYKGEQNVDLFVHYFKNNETIVQKVKLDIVDCISRSLFNTKIPFTSDYVKTVENYRRDKLQKFADALKGLYDGKRTVDFLHRDSYVNLIGLAVDKIFTWAKNRNKTSFADENVKTFMQIKEKLFPSMFGITLEGKDPTKKKLVARYEYEPETTKNTLNTDWKKIMNYVNDMLNYTVALFNQNLDQLCKEFVVFWPKACSLQRACHNRSYEGAYINKSLKQLRKSLSTQFSSNKMMRPNFLRKCALLQCNAMIGTCFENPVDTSTPSLSDFVFDKINAALGNTSKKPLDITICIMCVVNLSKSANNPPPVPYIDTRDMKIELGRHRKQNAGELSQLTSFIQKVPFLNQLMTKYTLSKDWANPKINLPCINHAKTMCEYYNRMGYLPASILTNINVNIEKIIDDDNIAHLEKIIDELDTYSAASTIGTLMMTDTISKFNREYIPCMNHIGSGSFLSDSSYNIPLATNVFRSNEKSSNQNDSLQKDAYVSIFDLDKADKRRGPKAAGGARKKSKKSRSKSKSIK